MILKERQAARIPFDFPLRRWARLSAVPNPALQRVQNSSGNEHHAGGQGTPPPASEIKRNCHGVEYTPPLAHARIIRQICAGISCGHRPTAERLDPVLSQTTAEAKAPARSTRALGLSTPRLPFQPASHAGGLASPTSPGVDTARLLRPLPIAVGRTRGRHWMPNLP